MVVLLAMVAFAIDSGYMLNVRTELQRAADAGAMAGAGAMINGLGPARKEAIRFVQLNRAGARQVKKSSITVEFGTWDKASRAFTVNPSEAAGVRVKILQPNNSLFFARVLGQRKFTSQAEAVAIYKPRDIMLCLDYSGSMCFDSQLRSINALGQTTVENNLRQIYQELGSPSLGLMQLVPVYISIGDASTVKNLLGLTKLSYPFPGGSWDDYIDYVQSDKSIASAGYEKHYGYLTWVNYLLARQTSVAATPKLWKTSEQPLTAVKDAVDLFISYIKSKSPDDHMGFSLYTAADNTAILESGLTKDFNSIAKKVRQRQAGHYVGSTNIYDGMKTARLELEKNARPGAMQMMILMTDGVANMPGDAANARKLVLQEAQAAADSKIKIIAIALGSLADTALMEEVANICGGASFIIPGGRAASEYQEDLEEVFRKVAADRPLELVQ